MLRKIFLIVILIAGTSAAQARELPDFTALVEKYGSTVVNVSTTQTVQTSQGIPVIPGLPEGDPLAEFFRRFGAPMPQEQETHSLGSGFIISTDGYILTNAHVVDSADKITVKLTDQREYKAKVIGADRRTDVALIKIEATGLPKINQGDPASLKVGEWVLAIGSPFGFDNSVTAGIVSGKGRSLQQENFVPFIQTDVAINPGNSGGPLFNMKGEVIGINSQIYSRSGGYMGLSFAIPIDVAMEVANQLRSSGKVTRGRMGVIIQDVTKALAESFGMHGNAGALISSVEKGGPADKAGIEPSDIILKFDNKVINTSRDLPRIVAGTRPGSKVTVQLWRKGATKEVMLVVGEMPSDGRNVRSSRSESAGEQVARLGLVLTELNDEQKKQLDIESGLIIEEVKSSSARAELQRGDILLAINNAPVDTIEQVNNILKPIAKGKNVALWVRRGDSKSFVPIKLDEK